MTKKNKNAGFSIRFLSLLIDVIIFSVIGISSSLMCLEKKIIEQINTSIYIVKNDYTYYLWLLLLIVLLSVQFIILPLIFNGKTLGMIITRLKLNFENENKKYFSILKRIELGPLLWILVVIMFISFVSPTIVNKMTINIYIDKHYDVKELNSEDPIKVLFNNSKWTPIETAFYTIPAAISPITLVFQLFMLISTGFKKRKISLLDKFSESQIVYENKFVEKLEIKRVIIEPEKEINLEIIWKE